MNRRNLFKAIAAATSYCLLPANKIPSDIVPALLSGGYILNKEACLKFYKCLEKMNVTRGR